MTTANVVVFVFPWFSYVFILEAFMVIFVVVSLAAYTAVALLFKAAARRTRSDHLVVVAVTIVALLAALTMLVRGEWNGSWLGAVIALVSGGLFYVASVYRVRSLSTTPVSLVFALTNLDLVISGAIVLFIPLFEQSPTWWRLIAIAITALAILVSSQIRGIERLSANAFISLALLAASALGFVVYVRLFPTALLFFILLDHLAGVALNGRVLSTARPTEMVWGVTLGGCMFIGFWSLLQALATSGNNVTLVLLALSMKTPLIALLAIPIFRERVTLHKVASIGLATLALVLWEMH